MRQAIRRFLKHLDAEKNASVTTIKGNIDLDQAIIRLHRKGGEVNLPPLADSAKIELKAYLKHRRRRNRTRLYSYLAAIKISRGTVWCLVKSYFKKSRIKTHRMGPHALRHIFARLLLEQGENLRVIQSLMNPQESRDNSTVSAFSEP